MLNSCDWRAVLSIVGEDKCDLFQSHNRVESEKFGAERGEDRIKKLAAWDPGNWSYYSWKKEDSMFSAEKFIAVLPP